MRIPRVAAAKLPRSLIAGEAMNELVLNAATHPEAARITKALLGGGRKLSPSTKRLSRSSESYSCGLAGSGRRSTTSEEHQGVNAYLG